VRAALLLIAVGACQPMYKGKSEPLRDPKPIVDKDKGKHKDDGPKYVEECTVFFTGDSHGVRAKPAVAQQQIARGDDADARAVHATDDHLRATDTVAALEAYIAALRADPYDAEATLKVALEYDHLYRKGCALAMLRRLASLTNNTKLAPRATRMIDQVADNAGWFKAYRKDALAALQR
jgi:hypothetical protein